MTSRKAVKASLIHFLLSFDPKQRPNDTSLHHQHWQQKFLGTSRAIF